MGNTGGGGSVSKITPGGNISTFASGGFLSGSDYGVAVDGADNVFVANVPENSVVEITPGGTVSEFHERVGQPRLPDPLRQRLSPNPAALFSQFWGWRFSERDVRRIAPRIPWTAKLKRTEIPPLSLMFIGLGCVAGAKP